MYPHDESAAFHLPAVYRNARRCRVNDAIAENYTRRGRASYSYTLESLSGIIHYSLIMIFAAFFVFFPPSFRSPWPGPRPWQSVCLHARARPWKRWRDREEPYDGCTYDISLSFALFLLVPELSARARHSIFSRFTLKHKYKSQEHRRSIGDHWSYSPLLFSRRRDPVGVRMSVLPTCVIRTHGSERIRRKPLPRTPNVPSVKSIFSPDALFTAPGDKRIFDLGP